MHYSSSLGSRCFSSFFSFRASLVFSLSNFLPFLPFFNWQFSSHICLCLMSIALSNRKKKAFLPHHDAMKFPIIIYLFLHCWILWTQYIISLCPFCKQLITICTHTIQVCNGVRILGKYIRGFRRFLDFKVSRYYEGYSFLSI